MNAILTKMTYAGVSLCATCLFSHEAYAQLSFECPQDFICLPSTNEQVIGFEQISATLHPFGNGPKPPSNFIERPIASRGENWSAITTAENLQFYQPNNQSLEAYILGFGYAMNYPSQQEAAQAALQMCEGDQLPGCQVRTIFRKSCLAMAFDQHNSQAFAFSVSADRADARNWATQLCREINSGQLCYVSSLSCN